MSKEIINKKIFLLTLTLLMCSGVYAVGDSDAVFTDIQRVEGNRITAGEWVEDNGPEETIHGDVIINEIHWAGSPASGKGHDQWIELFNTTGRDISLKNWTIENAGRLPMGLRITGNPTIKAGDYLLITRRKPISAESALAIESDVQNASLYLNRAGYKQLILRDVSGNKIDRTPEENSPWPEGEYEDGVSYLSMQRKSGTRYEGEKESSWYTCDPDGITNSESYWKEEYASVMCGTPNHPNQPISEGTDNVSSDNLEAEELSIDGEEPEETVNEDVAGSVDGANNKQNEDTDQKDNYSEDIKDIQKVISDAPNEDGVLDSKEDSVDTDRGSDDSLDEKEETDRDTAPDSEADECLNETTKCPELKDEDVDSANGPVLESGENEEI